MKVFFITPQTMRRPERLLLAAYPWLVWHTLLNALLPAVFFTAFLVLASQWPINLALLYGGGMVLATAALIALVGGIHELAHAQAGARLVGSDYPKALAIPAFERPFIRFASQRQDVAPASIVIILLAGPAAGLLVAGLLLIAVVWAPDPLSIRWMWWGYWGAITFTQLASLVPIGDTDGDKVWQLMRARSLSWSDVLRTAGQLVRGPAPIAS